MPRRIVIIFISAFILNLIWEHLHSVLYVSYKGETVTNLILLRAALFDAAVISFSSYPFLLWKPGFYRCCRSLASTTLFVVCLTLFAVTLEKWALITSRWTYTDTMPIIPFLDVGLTPAIQLGLLGYLSVWFADFYSKKTASRESVSGTP